jgi:uncharacterized lipoprotein YbaY
VEVLVSGPARPPAGAPVIVQVRDTGLADAPATILGEARGTVAGGRSDSLATVEINVAAISSTTTIWAHVDVDGDGRVSQGDYVTTQSYPVPRESDPRLPVAVKPV